MNLAAFLVGMVGPLAARWLASMGLSLVVMAGATEAMSSLRSVLVANLGGLPQACVQLLGLFGVFGAIGILLGAYTFSLTWAATKGFWSLAKS